MPGPLLEGNQTSHFVPAIWGPFKNHLKLHFSTWGSVPTLEGKWHILAQPFLISPFVHLCSEQHFPHPGL